MSKYFSVDCPEGPFVLFSEPHIAAIVFIALICFAMYFFRDLFKNDSSKKIFRYGLAAILILQEASFQIWNMATGQWALKYDLPLQLCGISTILSSIMLICRNYSIYEVVYFWGIGGAIQAILTPEIGIYTFPHYRYFQFFLGHGAIIIACLFMSFVEGYRPRTVSVLKSVAYLNIYALLVGMFNKITGANYLFICQKPQIPSIMDYLGPWPFYILSLEFVAILNFFILYLPFDIPKMLKKEKNRDNFLNYN